MEEQSRAVREGRVKLPRVGAVRGQRDATLPYRVTDDSGEEVEPCSAFLRDLMLSDARPSTCRSCAHDLLRWWRLLQVVGVAWDQATREEVELLVGWLRSAGNPQRSQRPGAAQPAGSVNLRTGKASLNPGYAPSKINHALSVLSSFYEFHLHFGRGPLLNPVPTDPRRRRALAHRSPIDPVPEFRRAPLRQKSTDRGVRSIPEGMWAELVGQMSSYRDRALLEFYVSSGARASELVGLRGRRVDWGNQRIWICTKGSDGLEAVPGSPEAFRYLAWYFDEYGTPTGGEPVWRTLRGSRRPLTYAAMRRVLQRANDRLGTNWTLHDLRHTAGSRMAADPALTLTEVQAVMRHRHLATTERYTQPRADELFDKLQQHFSQPRQNTRFTPGYAADDVRTVFGG